MQYEHIPYEAFGEGGEYTRAAREIGELPWEMRAQALKDATSEISGLIGQQAARVISQWNAGLPGLRHAARGGKPACACGHPPKVGYPHSAQLLQ